MPIKRKIIILVSEARHPTSGRICGNDLDSRALELALSIQNTEVRAVYAGPENPALMDEYLGLGAPHLDCLRIAANENPVPSLLAYLREHQPDGILTGVKASVGRCSGLLPYTIAESLDRPLVPNISLLSFTSNNTIILEQSLLGGRRRKLSVNMPFVASVSSAAPSSRPYTYAKARRGAITVCNSLHETDLWLSTHSFINVQNKPKRIHSTAISGKADERLERAFGVDSHATNCLIDPDPDMAATEIINFLLQKKVIEASSSDKPNLGKIHYEYQKT
ncbi:hypothetical protein MNBD_ALPHA03-482 [hydrothermal vent metagenome]|uniref:Uncharacterized protein n=1 Tax=hydrothermal vent metagenome TaxID=652676 RepID=A0A3B1BV04_9ZZZZ